MTITPGHILAFGAAFLMICIGLVILRLRGTMGRVDLMVDETKKSVVDILKEIESNVESVKEITKDIDGKLEKTDRLFQIFDEVNRGLQTPAAILSRFFEGASIQCAALAHAVKEGVKTFYAVNSPPSSPPAESAGRLP